ncbi:MAG: hypothetical protein Q7S00_06820 [bacterium]|nr:hypothetical protein [bacterium]
MEEINYWALLLIAIAGVNLYFCYKFRTDETFAINYVKTSPKAYIWRKLWGEEKALHVIHKVFVPIGLVISGILALTGIFFLLF